MRAGGIGLAEVAFRNAVITEENVLRVLRQVQPHARRDRVEVIRIVVERRHEAYVEITRARDASHRLDGRLGGRHRILRIERHDDDLAGVAGAPQELVDAVSN